MRIRTALLLILVLTPTAHAEENEGFEAGEAISHKNLTVFPLYRGARDAEMKANLASDEVMTFEEALASGELVVTELDGNTSDAQVNAVHVTNRSQRDVFIMGGEVILGGKQDRIIGKDTVIPGKASELEVGVFCVEHGRWDGQTADFRASGSVSHSKLREQAVFNDSQSMVWAEVAVANQANQASNETDTYQKSLKVAAGEEVRGYVDEILPALVKDPRTVGLVVAISGKIVAVDAFANPKLFAKMRMKLVSSYALEASSAEDTSAAAAIEKAEVAEILADIENAKNGDSKESGGASNVYNSGARTKGVKAMKMKADDSFDFEDEAVHEFYTVD